MIFGDLGGLKLPDICLTGEENPRKNLTQETCPDRGSNPGPLRDRRACYRLVVLWEVNNVCNNHSNLGYNHARWRVHEPTPLEQFQPLEQGHIVSLWEAGWTYRRVAAHVGHSGVSAFSSGLWNISTPVDQVLDGHVIQTQVKIDALCEQHPGKKSGNILNLLCHQGPLGTVCMQQDSGIWPGYHLKV